jgi:hypothetical protein
MSKSVKQNVQVYNIEIKFKFIMYQVFKCLSRTSTLFRVNPKMRKLFITFIK